MEILLEGQKATNISFSNYHSRIKTMGFPEVPKIAFDISYLYKYDGYLPSFIFNLNYKVPLHKIVSVYETKTDGIVKIQTVVDEGNYRLVSYTEFQE